jgi:pyruvate,water dikinase
MAVRWLEDITGEEVATFGGKAASLGELASMGLPVPEGFVVTTDTFQSVLAENGIEEELESIVDVDPDDQAAVSEAAHRARSLVRTAAVPESIRAEIEAAYDRVEKRAGADPAVAVRSSATTEDLPDSSFAGQQETFLNVTRDGLLDRISACWASLFTERAIHYRRERGYTHRDAAIAVVVQRMVEADKSGVMFTAPPSKPGDRMVIEAVWGLGEAAVSGAVTPDNYTVDRERKAVLEASITEQERMLVLDEESDGTVERAVPAERRTGRVLTDDEIESLAALGEQIHDAYGSAQDVEWAIAGGEVYLLQSRPITTREDDGVLTTGLGASPGKGSGPVVHVDGDAFEAVEPGDVLVTTMTTPDMMPAIRRAAGIVTDEGGETCHAAIVSRELGVPAVVGTGDATTALSAGQTVTVDGDTGSVLAGDQTPAAEAEAGEGADATAEPAAAAQPVTGTAVMVNVAIPESAGRAAGTGADGVGLLRLEHLVLSLGKTPTQYVADHGAEAYVTELADGIREVAEAFYPRPVRVRTLDAPTDEFRELEGGGDEPEEANPMLGYRGIRRSLDQPQAFRQQLRAVSTLQGEGYDNIEVMFPLITDETDAARAREAMAEAGLDPAATPWGTMIETPASALCIEDIVGTGLDFVSFGTNDLTQYTLAVDRNNERIADRYDATHPAVLALIERVIETCREHGVKTSICGEAGSDPAMIEHLVTAGIDSISVNVDAVADARERVARVERRELLDVARERR